MILKQLMTSRAVDLSSGTKTRPKLADLCRVKIVHCFGLLFSVAFVLNTRSKVQSSVTI